MISEIESFSNLTYFKIGIIIIFLSFTSFFLLNNKNTNLSFVSSFNYIEGLEIGSNVVIAGIKVGEVFCAAKGTWGGELDLLVVVRPVGHTGITQDRYAESLTTQWISAD